MALNALDNCHSFDAARKTLKAAKRYCGLSASDL